MGVEVANGGPKVVGWEKLKSLTEEETKVAPGRSRHVVSTKEDKSRRNGVAATELRVTRNWE